MTVRRRRRTPESFMIDTSPTPSRRPEGLRRPRTIGAGLRIGITSGLACLLSAGLVPTIFSSTASAAPMDKKPSQAARLAGITATGGGYAGWAMRQQPTVRSNSTMAAATTPAGVPGIDVASYQGNVNWSNWYANGKRWAYTKATEGTSYTNPYFSQQYTGSYKVGMIRGAYHFARPDNGTGAAQAKYFVAHGGGWSGDGKTLPGALDIEDNYTGGGRCWGNTDAQNVAWVKSFLAEYKRLTGRDAVIYSNISFWKDCLGNTTAFSSTSPFWLAYWSSKRPSSYPGGWTYDTFWQYSGTGSTDLDVFNGTSTRLKVLATGTDPNAASNADPDGDGLTNAQESKYGTNPDSKDTDRDGLSDKAEVTGTKIMHYGVVTTNPLKKDTDGDGLSDKTELTGILIKNYGTVRPNPRAKDSDGDGLSDYTEVKTGFPVWTAKRYVTYASPNVKDTDHDGYSDATERSLHLSPRRKDTDKDGYSDKTERTGILLPRYGTVKPNPLRKDSDGDGWGDRTELTTAVTVRVKGRSAYKAYSSPNRKDSDRDGVSDVAERKRGTDPVKKDTDRDGVRDKKDHHPLNPKRR
jgi:GH25 family lysozyme M1 (1,4-beta-N-acetylmuramidase)